MVQSATDTRSLQMNNMNNTTAVSCFPYVTYTQRNANKSEYNTRPHQQQQRQGQQQAVHANIRNSNSYSANNKKNYLTSLPASRATTASIAETGKTNTSRSNSYADKTKRNNSSTKINNLTEIKKLNSNVEVDTTTKEEKQQEEKQKEEIKRDSVEEQEKYHVSKTTSNTEADWLRRSTLQRQRDEMDKAHHLQFLKLCGKIGPKPWRHSTVAEQKDMSALGNTNNQNKKENIKECKEELSSLMPCDAFCSSPSSLSSSSSSSTSLLPLCNTNRIGNNSNNYKKKEKKKKNSCSNTDTGKDERISKKKLADVDATDEDVYELVYGVGTCGYLQQWTQRAQRQALPSTNYNSTTNNNNNDKEESDHNTNDNATTLTAISANTQDKPLPIIQSDKRKKTNVFDRLRHGNNNKRNTYMILNADNNNKKKREETLPPLALSRADHPLSMQPTPQGASTTSESTLGPTSSASPESSSSLMHEASMYVAPSTQSRNSLSSAIVGGQMDVFGYFATHRVFPHYYDTLQTRFYSTRIA